MNIKKTGNNVQFLCPNNECHYRCVATLLDKCTDTQQTGDHSEIKVMYVIKYCSQCFYQY